MEELTWLIQFSSYLQELQANIAYKVPKHNSGQLTVLPLGMDGVLLSSAQLCVNPKPIQWFKDMDFQLL